MLSQQTPQLTLRGALRNGETSLFTSMYQAVTSWQAAPRNEVDPFKQRQLGIKEVQDSGERKVMSLPALQIIAGVGSALVPKAGDAQVLTHSIHYRSFLVLLLNYEIFQIYECRIK